MNTPAQPPGTERPAARGFPKSPLLAVAVIAVVVAAAAVLVPWGPPPEVYLIGNSLTQDLLSEPDHDATGADAAAGSGFGALLGGGRTHGASLRWGQPLRAAAEDPPRGLRGGGHAQVVLQPWSAPVLGDGTATEPVSTYAQERAAFAGLARLAAPARVFLYATWADAGETDRGSDAVLRRWARPFAGEGAPFYASGPVYERLEADLAADGLRPAVIPAGAVFAELIAADNGIGAAELMRDGLHASRLGRYAAAATAAAVMMGADPAELPLPGYYTLSGPVGGSPSPPVTAAQAEAVRSAVSRVLAAPAPAPPAGG